MRACAVVALLSLSCNSTLTPIKKEHDQPVTVTTSPIPANVVWVVDKSGSMLAPINSDPPCSPICGPGNPCPAGCTTRIDLLQQAIASTALDAGTNTLVFFPKDNVCGLPTSTETFRDLTFDELVAQAALLMPSGGTPTSDTLDFVRINVTNRSDDAAAGAGSLVLLLTDGVPNCNANNPNTCMNASACQCTTSSCTGSLCSLGCLDADATTVAASALISAGNDMMVLPIGLGGNGADQYGAEAFFAGLPSTIERGCATDTDCNTGSTCGTNRVCTGAQWSFASMTEFVPAATRIHQEVLERSRCNWSLGSPETVDSIQVQLNGAEVDSTQWKLRNPTTLHFTGATCQSLLADSTLAPSVVEP